MKQVLTITALAATFMGVLFAGVYTAQAANDDSTVITDQQVAVIRARCGGIQTNLNRIHESDKVLRVNKGYLYKAIVLDKLMTPLNQRIAANQLDGGKLVATAAEYNRTFEKFDDAYSVYERNLSAATKIDCTKQPTAFHDQLVLAYESRKDLFTIDRSLVELSKKFQVEAKKFQKELDDSKEVE